MAIPIKPISIKGLAIAAALVSALESALVWSGLLQPVLSYSLGNVVFSLSRAALAAYAGILVAGNGLKQSAIAGAKVMLSGTLVLCAAALVGRFASFPTLLGISAGMLQFLIVLAIVLIGNTALGAILGALAWHISLKFRK
jgi:hypothetical protein